MYLWLAGDSVNTWSPLQLIWYKAQKETCEDGTEFVSDNERRAGWTLFNFMPFCISDERGQEAETLKHLTLDFSDLKTLGKLRIGLGGEHILVLEV